MQYISGPYTQGQLLKEIHEIEIALSERFTQGGVITDAGEQKSWRDRVLEASFGRNTVLYDDQGNPSVMVIFPPQTEADLLSGGRNTPHQAFIINNVLQQYLYISKYQNIVVGSGVDARAVSLKFQDPKVYIDFDGALAACSQKGTGWHLMTNAEWAAIALWCKKQGFWPRGNNSDGKDYAITSEKGIPSHSYDRSGTKYIGRVLTGSGPLSWTHDGSPFGIYDLNGNVWEWIGGYRTNNGEIQILPNNDAASSANSQAADSTKWKAILQDGSLVAPGTANTLKWDYTAAPAAGAAFRLNTTVAYPQADDTPYGANSFAALTTASGVTVPEILKALALFPADTGDHGGDYIYMRNNGERLAFRGGVWSGGSGAGVFALGLGDPRSSAGWGRGFRAAFCNL